MIRYTQGNLLEADAEALVNTVNTVGVMGKGIALMFKEAFPENFKEYEKACKAKEVKVGHIFATRSNDLYGPKWIINFPTKQDWKHPTKMEWVESGLKDLYVFIIEHDIRSIAIPPLGSGNGGLDWQNVKPKIEAALSELKDVDIVVYEPTAKYQNVAKKKGVKKLTPARALIAELVRRYLILGIECSLLEIQKLAWFLEREIEKTCDSNPLELAFKADRYGPYADKLRHLLDALDGTYLHCDKRISDAKPSDSIWFNDSEKDKIQIYLKGKEANLYLDALEKTSKVIDGFESPFGMELLATVDWLLYKEQYEPTVKSIKQGIKNWPAGKDAAERKLRIFNDRVIGIALDRLQQSGI